MSGLTINNDERKEIKSLTGLRAFAAIWVLVLHTCFGEVNEFGYFPAFDHKTHWGIFTNFILFGYLAVDLFFILSGFVMGHVYQETFRKGVTLVEAARFYARRLARIYPVHLVITLLLAAFYFSGVWTPFQDFTASRVWLSIGLLNVFDHPSSNMPAWSVSAEWLAYLACPFILWATGKMKNPLLLIVFVILLTVSYPYLYTNFFCCNWLAGKAAILRVMAGFSIGCILHRLYQLKWRAGFFEKYGDFLCAAAFVFLFALCAAIVDVSYVYPVLPLIIFFIAYVRGFMASIFANKVMVYLGVVSYCIYMVHYPVLEIYAHFFSEALYALPADYSQFRLWALALAVVASTIAAASAFYFIVERPCRRFVVKRLDSNG